MVASTKGNLDVVRQLIDGGANLQLRNKDGWNCLHIAARFMMLKYFLFG